jgi:N-acetylmuramoyl-L-alanine amidase
MSSAPITPEFQRKAPGIMQLMIDLLMMDDEESASALGSFGVETGGFLYREEVGGSGGYGWAMWTGSRRDDLEKWCAANNYNLYSEDELEYDEACLAFFTHEVTETWEQRVLIGGGTIDGIYYPALCDCPTLDQKVESFWRLYERPGVPHEDWRREMAHEALRLYRGHPEEKTLMAYERIVISSGHGKFVRGAHGIIDEVDQARRVVDALAEQLSLRGTHVNVFHDDVSSSQSENLNRIVDHHNDQQRDLDISVHFNAFEQVEKPMGVEVLYVSQAALAGQLSEAIAKAGGFINRGGKKRTDLMFLNQTDKPSVMLETCFVDSEADCDLYDDNFDDIIDAIATALAGPLDIEAPILPPEIVLPPPARIDIEVSGDVIVFVNGQQIGGPT